MTLEQLKDGIRRLTPTDRIELYRWLDYGTAIDFCSSDFCSSDFCSRIGADRALQIRNEIERKSKLTDLTASPGIGSGSGLRSGSGFENARTSSVSGSSESR